MKKLIFAAVLASGLAAPAIAQTTGNQSTFSSINKVDGTFIAGAADLEYVLERGSPDRNIQCIFKANVTNNTDANMYVRVLKGNVKFQVPANGNEARRKVSTSTATTIAPGATKRIVRVNPNISTSQTPCTARGNLNLRVSASEAEANRGGFDRSQRKGFNIR